MLISKKWLSEFVNVGDSVLDKDLASRLTNTTVEVEGLVNQAASFDHMVLGRVVSASVHPNADRLKVCQVDIGSRTVTIVCGGSNVVDGMKVAVALPGSKVRWHGEGEPVELQPTTIRGVASEGMMCAGNEIGMGKPTDAEREILDLSQVQQAPGTPLAVVFSQDDVVFEIEHKSMTNRPDLFGHYGLAREIAALYQVPLAPMNPPPIVPGSSIELSARVKDKQLCSRYMAVALEGVRVEPSPAWLATRLQTCGLKSINNLVDITNYILLELGEPMHVFDADKIGGNTIDILVRGAKKNESLAALDGATYALKPEDLVITDGKKPIAIAGVMGGQESGVSENTTRIVFEAATFSSMSIRKTSQSLGLRSESSARFEKALDPHVCEVALARAVELVIRVCPNARVVSAIVDTQKKQPKPMVIRLSPAFVQARLGVEISVEEMIGVLTRLGCAVTQKGKKLSVIIPSWRATKDISIAEDLVEEIARFYGYDRIPSLLPVFSTTPPKIDRVRELARKASDFVATGFGGTEVFTYAFANPETLTKLGANPEDHIKLANPLSQERPYLVKSLVPNVLECVVKNQRMHDSVVLFEHNRVFLNDYSGVSTGEGSDLLPKQPHLFVVAIAKKGITEPFWNAKQIVCTLMEHLGYSVAVQSVDVHEPWQHAGRHAGMFVSNVRVGTVAEVDPTRAEAFGLDHKTAVAEIDFDLLASIPTEPKAYSPVALFPSVTRDLAFLIAETVEYAKIESTLVSVSSSLSKVELFDVYRGGSIEAGKKSLAIHVEFCAKDRTLQSAEVEAELAKLREVLQTTFGATIR